MGVLEIGGVAAAFSVMVVGCPKLPVMLVMPVMLVVFVILVIPVAPLGIGTEAQSLEAWPHKIVVGADPAVCASGAGTRPCTLPVSRGTPDPRSLDLPDTILVHALGPTQSNLGVPWWSPSFCKW